MEIIFRDPNLNNVEWEITKQESISHVNSA